MESDPRPHDVVLCTRPLRSVLESRKQLLSSCFLYSTPVWYHLTDCSLRVGYPMATRLDDTTQTRWGGHDQCPQTPGSECLVQDYCVAKRAEGEALSIKGVLRYGSTEYSKGTPQARGWIPRRETAAVVSPPGSSHRECRTTCREKSLEPGQIPVLHILQALPR